jgi:dynein heavy chain
MKKGGIVGLEEFYKKLNEQMDGTVNLVRTELSALQRCTIEAMIVLDVHARDTIKDDMIDVGEASHNSFAWLK